MSSAPVLRRPACGDAWTSHSVLAASWGLPAADCEGTLHFVDVTRPALYEAACDECSLVVGVRPGDVPERPEQFWWQR